MQGSHRIVRKHQTISSARSLLTLAVSDALTSCRRAAAAPRRREAQAALVMATAMTFAFAGLPAHAQSITTWTGEESSDWFDGDNWSQGAEPTIIDDVIIDAGNPTPAVIDGRYSRISLMWIGYESGGIGNFRITDGGWLDSRSVWIGFDPDTQGAALVSGGDSQWRVDGPFVVGDAGIGTLLVEAGGTVTVLNSDVVIGNGEGSVGEVTVTGTESSWSNWRNLFVGNAGAGRLLVEAGGAVDNQEGIIGSEAGSVGEATVTGNGSTWTNGGALTVGREGQGLLRILDGGLVESAAGSIDSSADSGGGVEVIGTDPSGASSSWKVGPGRLLVGNAGTGSLRIEDGGLVVSNGAAIGHGFVDYDDDAIGSSVEVIGSGTYWANVGGLLVGENSLATMEVLDGGSVQTDSTSLGANPGSEGRVRVNGFDAGGVSSRLDIVGDLLVGDEGTGKLLVDNAGWLRSVTGIIGDTAGSTGSRALVTGTGSAWINMDTLSVGKGGEGILEILDGGRVESRFGYIGRHGGSDGKVLVSGVDSAGGRSSWVADGSLYVGEAGNGLLFIEAGGTVSSEDVMIAHEAGSVGEVRVTGVDSNWSVEKILLVGFHGRGSLSVEASGMVSSESSYLGVRPDSVGEATVTGAGSRWMLQGLLEVGLEGSAALLVEAGGQVSNTLGVIGEFGVSSGEVTVTGSGSNWTSSEALTVGQGGEGILEVLDGGHVESASGSIGTETGSDGRVRVSGVDSAGTRSNWEIDTGNLTVADAGAGLLLVEAGGRVRNLHGFIGDDEGSVGEVTVTGEGSAWINDHGLWVGNAGSGVLEIRDGGVVGSVEGVVGNANASDGAVLVDGAGSRWDIGGGLVVGNLGSGQVILSNGGVATSMYGAIGSQGQELSTVLVQGAGSAWTGLQGLYLGLEGNGALTLAEGGRVEVMAGIPGPGVVLGGYGGSSGTLNIGAGGTAGVLDTASITSGDGTAMLNFNHNDANYFFSNDGTASGTAVLIDGTTTVNQIGTGTTVLTGAHTYTGATNVNAGTLLVEGSLSNTATTVADGATLGGSGSIAGAVTIDDGGILAPGSSAGTLTVDSLSLSSGSILDYELGQAGVIGDGVNDLVEVTGNLTLDGTLDITDIGGFGAGVYRLMNYGGDLTDQGLEIGDVPNGGDPQDLFVQTAIGGQVNMVNSAGLTLSFWDGSVAGEHNNGAIDDGDGVWNAGNDNWTGSDGALNGRWDNGTFAVFGGTAGNVDVVGEQAIAGLQFMSGYTLATGTDGALRIDGADSVIRVDPNVTATITAPITGAGGLIKTDTGTLVLSGDNTYLGGTTIRTGTLSVSSDANLGDAAGGLTFDGGTLQTTATFDSARDVDLQAGGGTFLTEADLGLGGVISGAGTLTKDGEGTLTLTGDNTYAGGTRVLDGTLVGDTGSIRGNLANNGTVVFDQVDDDTFAGAIAGSGTMAKDGVGVLTLMGNSALDWSIDTGALVAQAKQFGGDASIADGARLRFTEAAGTYAGTLSDAGAFEIAGDGIFAMTGNSAGFAGTTSLESGTLQLDGALGGSTRIANGAVLGGIGTLHDVDNHGTIAPGNSIGTLTLTGDYLHHDDATLLAEIEPGGDSDLLDIAGSATIEGGTVEIVKLPGQYEGGTRYTLIDAAGGVSGTFGTLDQDLPFLDLLLGYDANHVYLDVQRNEVDFNIVCGDGTFNQCQVAGALDRVADGEISDDLQATLAEVTTLDLPGAQAAFDTLSGEAHGSLTGILLEGHALYGQAVSRRIADRRDEAGAARLQGGAWVRAYGASSDLDGDGNAHAADFEQRGLAVGFDAWGDEHWLIGASFNAMSVDADFRPGDRGEADTKNASLYTSFQGGHAYLDAVTSFAWWNNEITRRIEVGSIAREARSEYGGHRFATHLEAGWNFALGQSQQLTPLISVEYAKLDQEGFREEGAQDLNLIGRSQDVERTTVSAGLRWTTAFERGGWTFEPTVQARWLHALGDEYAEQDVAFAGAPDIGYRVRGVSWPQDRGLLGVGLQMRHGDNLDLFVDLDYQKGGGLEAKNLGMGVRWRW